MSAHPSAAPTTLADFVAPTPPYEPGDFGSWTGDSRYRLDWCPLCVLDPARPAHQFSVSRSVAEDRAEHFATEHGPDDVGRPLAELLPGGGR